jgi:hypothetical protein
MPDHPRLLLGRERRQGAQQGQKGAAVPEQEEKEEEEDEQLDRDGAHPGREPLNEELNPRRELAEQVRHGRCEVGLERVHAAPNHGTRWGSVTLRKCCTRSGSSCGPTHEKKVTAWLPTRLSTAASGIATRSAIQITRSMAASERRRPPIPAASRSCVGKRRSAIGAAVANARKNGLKMRNESQTTTRRTMMRIVVLIIPAGPGQYSGSWSIPLRYTAAHVRSKWSPVRGGAHS